jgi:hypothetical protein
MAVPNMLLRGHSISAFLSNNDFVKDERPWFDLFRGSVAVSTYL